MIESGSAPMDEQMMNSFVKSIEKVLPDIFGLFAAGRKNLAGIWNEKNSVVEACLES